MPRRHPLFWPLAAAYAAATLVWTFSAPVSPEKFYRAFPAETDFLSVHRDLAGRWNEIGASPVVETVFTSSGMKPDEFRALNRNPQFRDWMNRLLTGEFAAGQFTALHGGPSAWLFTATLGGKSQAYRLALQLSSVPGLRYEGTHHGWPVWAGSASKSKTGEIFAFSLVEGLIVATYGAGTEPLRHVLDCVDRRHPSLGNKPAAHPPATAADCGWFKINHPASYRFTDIERATFELTTFTSNRIAGHVSVPRPWLTGAAPIEPRAAAGFAEIQTDLPTAVAIVPPALVSTLAGATNPIASAAASFLHQQTTGPVFLSLFGGDYRGRFLQARVPGLILAARSTNTAGISAHASETLARLNETTRLKLELENQATQFSSLWNIASRASNTLYGMTAPADRFGIVAATNWAGLVTCVSAFEKISNDAILRANRPLRLASAAATAAQRNAPAYAWLHLPDTAPALRTAAGTWVMKLKSQNTRSSQATRNQINTTMRWFNGLQPLGTLELTATPDGKNTVIEFSSTPAR